VLGDSYVNWMTHSFPVALAREAGETWRLYAVGGTAMATGGIAGLIPPQLPRALAADKDIVAIVSQPSSGARSRRPAFGADVGTACSSLARLSRVTGQRSKNAWAAARKLWVLRWSLVDAVVFDPMDGRDHWPSRTFACKSRTVRAR
jgi:hypothetical protein